MRSACDKLIDKHVGLPSGASGHTDVGAYIALEVHRIGVEDIFSMHEEVLDGVPQSAVTVPVDAGLQGINATAQCVAVAEDVVPHVVVRVFGLAEAQVEGQRHDLVVGRVHLDELVPEV